jgi:hypothetical protein
LLVKNPHIPPSKARATSAARIASWITTPTATAAGSNRGESLLHWWMVRRLPCQQKTLQLKIDGLAVLKWKWFRPYMQYYMDMCRHI